MGDQELIKEARSYVCNALAAYAEAFALMSENELDEDFFASIEEFLAIVESMIPMFKTMWEIDKKRNPDKSFVEFIIEAYKGRG